jgi:hypothetical protein
MQFAKRVLLLSAVASIWAANADAVVNIQNTGASARSVGLGNAFVAIADDPAAIFANPAGLRQMKNSQIAYTNVSLLYSGVDDGNLGQHIISLVKPMGGRLSLGLALEKIGFEDFSENGAFFSLGIKFSKNLSLGVNAKYLFWSGNLPAGDPADDSGGSIGLDLGALWKTPFREAALGVMIKNLNKPNVAGGTVLNESDAGKLPMDLHLGLSRKSGPKSLVSVEWVTRDFTGDNSVNKLLVGGETKLSEVFMLRGGGSRFFEDGVDGDLNAGIGWKKNKTRVDYAYHIPLDLVDAGGEHRFTFTYGL